MSDTTTTTSTLKRWLIGLGMILVAALGWLVYFFDGDDATKPDTAAAISGVQSGVQYIQNGASATTSATVSQ